MGLAASLLGAQHVLLTDLPHLVPGLQANIQVGSTPAAHTAAALHACCPCPQRPASRADCGRILQLLSAGIQPSFA